MSVNNYNVASHIMETPLKQKERAMDIGSMLLSPPEPKRTEHTFSSPISMSMSRTPSQSTSAESSQSQGTTHMMPLAKKPERLPLSPPISPQQRKEDVVRADEGTRDPPLFPREESENANRGPLFPPQDNEQAAIDEHVANNGRICSDEDYRTVLGTLSNMKFTSSVAASYRRDPQKWYQGSLRTIAFYDNIKAKAKVAAKAADKAARHGMTQQRRLAPAPEGGIRKKVTVPRVQRVPKPKPSPPQHTFGAFAFPVREHVPKTPKLATSRDDVDFNSLQDFCPPTDNLGHNAKALKADWKGAMLDLSTDPDRHFLHEAEVNLAATLRLSCAVYLSSKRRIFIARVQCGQRGKEFRKTDAQQACKIDVNKASKLWSAFEKVGWFDDRFFVGKRAAL
jgi:hypothetical protein